VCPAPRVACFETDILKDVRKLQRCLEVVDPRGDTSMYFENGGLIRFVVRSQTVGISSKEGSKESRGMGVQVRYMIL
jgi:hypothetical protein